MVRGSVMSKSAEVVLMVALVSVPLQKGQMSRDNDVAE